MVYLGTVYIYCELISSTLHFADILMQCSAVAKKRTRNNVVLFAITAMFMITVAQTALQWAEVKKDLINSDASRFTSFVASALEPGGRILINDFCGLFTSVLADGLLVRRIESLLTGR